MANKGRPWPIKAALALGLPLLDPSHPPLTTDTVLPQGGGIGKRLVSTLMELAQDYEVVEAKVRQSRMRSSHRHRHTHRGFATLASLPPPTPATHTKPAWPPSRTPSQTLKSGCLCGSQVRQGNTPSFECLRKRAKDFGRGFEVGLPEKDAGGTKEGYLQLVTMRKLQA